MGARGRKRPGRAGEASGLDRRSRLGRRTSAQRQGQVAPGEGAKTRGGDERGWRERQPWLDRRRGLGQPLEAAIGLRRGLVVVVLLALGRLPIEGGAAA